MKCESTAISGSMQETFLRIPAWIYILCKSTASTFSDDYLNAENLIFTMKLPFRIYRFGGINFGLWASMDFVKLFPTLRRVTLWCRNRMELIENVTRSWEMKYGNMDVTKMSFNTKSNILITVIFYRIKSITSWDF